MGSKADEVSTPIAGETDATLSVGTSLEGMYLKVTVTREDGETAESAVTDAVGVNELALKSVEDASGGAGNIIIAYFNLPLDELTLSDVQIRRVSDDQLFPLESVILSSDGMSARIQLNDSQATIGATLAANTDYNLIVTSTEGTASKVFSIPATADGVTVVGYDKDKREIEVLAITGSATVGYAWAGATNKYQFSEDEEVDYANLLGETVTFKYDQNNTISNLKKLPNERVIYGAFKVVGTGASDVALQDQLTEEKYYPQDAFAGKIPSTLKGDYENKVALDQAWTATDMEGVLNKTYAYGKVVLNTNGTMRSFWSLENWSGNILVGSVSGNSIISQTKQEQSLENYTILEEGHTISVDDIDEGDVVFYNTTVKMAEVYDDVRVGELQAVYDNAGFKFEDKNRDGSAASYIDGTTQKTVTTDYLKAVKAEGEDITVIFNRANEVLYVLGEQGEVVSNSYDMVLAAKGDGYAGTTTGVIAIKGFDGDAIVSKEIKVSDLAEVTVNGKTYKKTAGTFYTSTGAAGSEAAHDWGTAKKEEALGFSGYASDGATAGTAAIFVLDTDLAVGTLVNVTENDNGAITKLEIKQAEGTLDPYTGTDKTLFDGANKAQAFKTGYKTLQKKSTATASAVLTLPASAKVYVVGKSNGSVTIDKTSYGDFDKQIDNANIGTITLYKSGTSVSNLIIDNTAGAAFSNDEDGATTIEGVVQEMHLLGGEVADITIVSKDGELTFDTFASDKTNLKTNFAQGTIVDVTVLKDGVTVSKVVADGEPSGNYTDAVYGVTTTAPGEFYVQAAAGGNAGTLSKRTLVSGALLVKVADNTVSTISLSDLKSLALKNDVVISTVVAGNDKVDTVVVTATARPTAATHTNGGVATASEDFTVAADALLKAIGTAGTYKAGVTVSAVADGTGNHDVAAITNGDEYSAAKSAMNDLKILSDDIIAADGTATTIQTKVWTANLPAYDIYTVLSKKADATGANNTSVAWAGKNVIVANTIDLGKIVKSAGNGANATILVADMPTSVTLESLDGTTYDISNIAKPTVTSGTGDALTSATTTGTGWYWADDDTFDGKTAAVYGFTLTPQTSNDAAYIGTATNVKLSFEVTAS